MLLVSFVARRESMFLNARRCSFGAAFVPFYRLFGPFVSPMAPQVIKTEIWDTITRRGALGNLIMGLIPMIFYLTLSGIALALEQMLRLVRVV